ncbi:GTPase Era [Apibacter muscae]|uniref:GTPase Era n=1 Tax=Apibacter muscae TaxID=2509004 RepID=A0A563DHP5_9FLAO|nr:GTPase Era [Apibacter muscae]TWP29690.1 GTPase Era [Apibacter muscae]
MTEVPFKSGFVNIIGKPNVGKSTLINLLMGEKLSIVTSKAQTTRHRIFGIWNDANVQIIFSDTPGIIQKPAYELQEKMNEFVKDSFHDADILLYLTELGDEKNPSEYLLNKINSSKVPILVLLNKVDNSKDSEQISQAVGILHEQFPNAEILPISALHGLNTDLILPKIISLLPESPPYYDKDQFTTLSERFFVNECIREKILLHYKKEIPYSVEVVTESFKEEDNMIRIESVIYVERETQKGILIGHKGEKIQKVGIEARLDLEKFFDSRIFLNLFVKVKKDWRSNDKDLKAFGYSNS